MFLLLTNQNCRDTTVPSIAPRFLTESFEKALCEARRLYQEEATNYFVANFLIFKLVDDTPYTLKDFSGEKLEGDCPIVFVAWKSLCSNPREWVETFHTEFELWKYSSV